MKKSNDQLRKFSNFFPQKEEWKAESAIKAKIQHQPKKSKIINYLKNKSGCRTE